MKKTTIPDLFLFFIIVQIVLHYFLPLKKIVIYPYILLGIPLIILGLYLNWIWGAIKFRKEKTTLDPNVVPTRFVTEGPFKFTRNPIYFVMVITLFGISILAGSISTFIIPIIFWILIDRRVISLEEKNMEKKFGKKYLDYKKKIRRWI